MKDESGWRKFFTRRLCVILFFSLQPSAFSLFLHAQESAPPPQKPGVQLQFVPPPMDGTISLGIYDAAGKLVRILHAEAQQTEFVAALNGLITFWDGKDDAGKLMPAGKYRARGIMAGTMDFQGVAFFGNDWVAAETSPRVRRVVELWSMPDGGFGIGAEMDGGVKKLAFSSDGAPAQAVGGEENLFVRDGKIFHSAPDSSQVELVLPALEKPVFATQGRNKTVWAIDGTDVKQFAMSGECLRRLAAAPDGPPPQKIAASQTGEEIFLLEQNDRLQRVRGLALAQPNTPAAASASPQPAPTSTWKVVFSKTITFSDTPGQVRDLLKMPDGKPFVPQEKIGLTLLPNPLEQNKPGAVEIGVGFDAKGSFLKDAGGLPLCRVSETTNLRWAAMAREPGSKTVIIFQSDGAVVEEFKAGRLANMMAFDCGDFDFDPAKIK